MINLLKIIKNKITNFKVQKQILNSFPQQHYFLTNETGKKLSFWNDIPINLLNDEVNCCIQIPKQRIAKMQVIKQLQYHPIVQDTRKNIYNSIKQKRYYAQFPYFNYGFIPQTWQQNITPDETGLTGDDDPLDIVELSSKHRNIGDIFRAKILGSFCLIDQGQVDWKIFLLDVQQARSLNVSQLIDLKNDRIKSIMNWFINIKTYDRKKVNEIAFNQKIFNKQQTIKIISKMNQNWQRLQTSDEFREKRKQFKIQK